MFESSGESSARRPRRVEVLTGPDRRRDWPDERKIAIVAESLEPGVNASALARSHDINPQQLFGWRRRFRAEAEALIAASRPLSEPISFAPVLIDAKAPEALSAPSAATSEGSIDIAIGGASVRIRGAVDPTPCAISPASAACCKSMATQPMTRSPTRNAMAGRSRSRSACRTSAGASTRSRRDREGRQRADRVGGAGGWLQAGA